MTTKVPPPAPMAPEDLRVGGRALHEDIHVTSFFREPEMFESLRAKVFPEIVRHQPEGVPVRMWVPGCSTGEEVYSLAIAWLEFCKGVPR